VAWFRSNEAQKASAGNGRTTPTPMVTSKVLEGILGTR